MDIPSTRTIKHIAQALAAEGECHAGAFAYARHLQTA